MFSEEFGNRLSKNTNTKWAGKLSEEELQVVLMLVWQWGIRASDILECLDRHESEFDDSLRFQRARLALRLLSRMAEGDRFTTTDLADKIGDVKIRWQNRNRE